jgi:Protein of unknown function (DUF1612)/HTH DNA binding domain
MSAIPSIYEIPEKPFDEAWLDAFFRTDEALSKLEERARLSPLRVSWSSRLLYRNACAAMNTQNCLVYLEDLVLLDGHAFAGAMYPDLSCGLSILKLWQIGLQEESLMLLRAAMPGELPRLLASDVVGDPMGVRDRPDFFYDPDWKEADRLEQWRRVWQETNRLPPLLAAAIVWDAWHGLAPEQQGTWRAPLLAALVLRARGKTRNLLLPIDTGQWLLRTRWKRHDSHAQRIQAFFDIVAAAVKHAGAELDGLESAKERMGLKLKGVRKNSRLADLIDLMIAKPLVSIPLACKELGISKQALRLLIPRLGSTPREITERSRYRCWAVT